METYTKSRTMISNAFLIHSFSVIYVYNFCLYRCMFTSVISYMIYSISMLLYSNTHLLILSYHTNIKMSMSCVKYVWESLNMNTKISTYVVYIKIACDKHHHWIRRWSCLGVYKYKWLLHFYWNSFVFLLDRLRRNWR